MAVHPTKNKAGVDWLKIEAEYRTGHWNFAELARRSFARTGVKITPQAVQVRCKRHGWVKDQTEEVRIRREAHLAQEAAVELEVEDPVEAAAQQQTAVVRGHKAVALRARRIVDRLLNELEWNGDNAAALEKMIPLIENGDPFDRQALRESWKHATALPSRAVAVQRLASALDTVVGIERKSFGITDGPPTEESYEDRLKKLVEGAANK